MNLTWRCLSPGTHYARGGWVAEHNPDAADPSRPWLLSQHGQPLERAHTLRGAKIAASRRAQQREDTPA